MTTTHSRTGWRQPLTRHDSPIIYNPAELIGADRAARERGTGRLAVAAIVFAALVFGGQIVRAVLL